MPAWRSRPPRTRRAGASYNWKMATGWPGGPLMDIGAKAFAERMELLSGGRFKIQVFPGRRARQRAEGAGNGEERRRRAGSYLDGLRLGQGPDHGAVRRLRRLVRHRAHAALDLRGRRRSRCSASSATTPRASISIAAVHPHGGGVPAFAQAGQDAGGPEGPEAAHRGRLARDGQGARRGAGHHRRRRRLSDARARRDRRDRVGHAVGEHLARVLQGREVPDLPGRAPAHRAVRAGASTRTPGTSCRRTTRGWWRRSRSW